MPPLFTLLMEAGCCAAPGPGRRQRGRAGVGQPGVVAAAHQPRLAPGGAGRRGPRVLDLHLDGGTRWKTLDDVDTVFVAAVDSREDPRRVEVYEFPAEEVRERFNAAYSARAKAGQAVPANFGMWINLDPDGRGLPMSVGSGLAHKHKPIAAHSIAALMAASASIADVDPGDPDGPPDAGPPGQTSPGVAAGLTIAEAKRRLAITFGVEPEQIEIVVRG